MTQTVCGIVCDSDQAGATGARLPLEEVRVEADTVNQPAYQVSICVVTVGGGYWASIKGYLD